jgi:hypothetical protein
MPGLSDTRPMPADRWRRDAAGYPYVQLADQSVTRVLTEEDLLASADPPTAGPHEVRPEPGRRTGVLASLFRWANGFLTFGRYSEAAARVDQGQITINLFGNDTKQNVPFRVNANTDVPVAITTMERPDSFLAVCKAGSAGEHGDPEAAGGRSGYLGWRDDAQYCLYGRDSHRPDCTLVLGSDGVTASRPEHFNQVKSGPLEVIGGIVVDGGQRTGTVGLPDSSAETIAQLRDDYNALLAVLRGLRVLGPESARPGHC